MPVRISQKIVDLMREEQHDLPWLIRAVQAAIELELSTIPPYLCALWSILDDSLALSHVRNIVRDEMGHLGLMCNLLKALRGQPKIVSAAPRFPGPLPGGVRPALTVYLSGLTLDSVRDVYMEIEKPENPLALFRLEETFTSIGKFYEAVRNAVAALRPPLSAAGQLTSPQVEVKVLASIPGALAAIDRIRMQGEGTTTSPYFDGSLAHFYKFGEIFHGRMLVEAPPGTFAFTGDPVPFPNTLPMARVPEGGWPNRNPDGKGTLEKFNSTYRLVLEGLENAWTSGTQLTLDQTIELMATELAGPAQTLMQTPRKSGGGNYGPDFVI
ncbi:MAG: hypothetical protein QOF63_352 [Thermoanaerobaculia bacterium]|jgi:hypothetical protein|nr:hypothetical protein [Thermoanaerobaculia bacterium]